jgi:Flp pilus assembly protein TadG
MMRRLRHRRWSRRPGRGPLGQRGIAAVEFAICAPVLLLLVFGTLEILMLYRTEEKLNSLAGNFAEMVSDQEIVPFDTTGAAEPHAPVPTQSTAGTAPPGLSDLCAGAVDGLQPFPASGLSIYIASVTETSASPPSYDEWEVDLDSNCTPTKTQNITEPAARALALGNGTTTALVQGQGDNVIIVRASLQYPGLVGLILTSAAQLTQTAIARWRYASPTNVTNTNAAPASPSTLEFSCAGTGCMINNGV